MKFLIRWVIVSFIAFQSYAATIKYITFPAGASLELGKPIIVNLPCYGDVRVTVTGATANEATRYTIGAPAFANQPQTVGAYSWASANGFGLFFNNTQDYTVTFDFLNGAPNSSRLVLVVAGLLNGSTATVSVP